MKNTETFIKDMITKTFPQMDLKGVNLMIEDTLPIFQDWLFAKINDALSMEQNAELADLMQKEDFDMGKVYTFLNTTIQNYPTWLENRYQEFEKKYQEEVKYFAEHEA